MLLRPSVLLLLVGDLPLLRPDGSFRHVHSEAELDEWLHTIPELSLVASLRGAALPASALQPQHWESIGERIRVPFRSVDGVVVAVPEPSATHIGVLLGFMIRLPGKPVIISGMPSPQPSRRGRPAEETKPAAYDALVRATLVNAVQSATLDLGEVALIRGNRLTRAVTEGSMALGQIDFGLKLAGVRRARKRQQAVFRTAVRPNIFHAFVGPSHVLPDLRGLDAATTDAVLLTLLDACPEDELARFAAALKRRRIVLALHHISARQLTIPDCLTIRRMTPSTAAIKLMWVLGQERRFAGQQRLLSENVAGEFLTRTEEKS